MTMQIQLAVTLPAPLEATFSFLADPRNRPLWQRSLDHVEMLSDGPPRVGTRWREWPPLLGEVTLEITELDPNRAWAERGVARAAQLDLRLEFASHGKRTELQVSARVSLSAWLGWAGSLARPALAREIRSDLERAGALLEKRLRR